MPIPSSVAVGRVVLTDDEAALIRGMNHVRSLGMGHVARPSNIAALYFDGRELAEMIRAKESVDKLRQAQRGL